MMPPARYTCNRNQPWWTRTGVLAAAATLLITTQAVAVDVPLWDRFETTVTNSKAYANHFTDVTLDAIFTSPSGRTLNFFGFYDGNGSGGQTGNVWKQRFMPDELGTWT